MRSTTVRACFENCRLPVSPPPPVSRCRRQTNLDWLRPNRSSAGCGRPTVRRRRWRRTCLGPNPPPPIAWAWLFELAPTDRFDLPLEVELALPADLAAKPVRAFLIRTNEAPREILAQLDRLDSQGKARLVLMLAGPAAPWNRSPSPCLPGTEPGACPPLPTAVSTTDATNGMRWIENDQVRLLLGPEGAHVYRWEVKAAGNRDLTMPGESDWHGFSDLHPHRSSPYQLNCRARGPAMVEYESTDPSGHTKILRLYGGASWIEELLNEPATVYWDFDNPKNFAGDGPTPGQWLFSDGQSGSVGREADGVPAQVKAPNTYWGIKHNPDRLGVGTGDPGNRHPACHRSRRRRGRRGNRRLTAGPAFRDLCRPADRASGRHHEPSANHLGSEPSCGSAPARNPGPVILTGRKQ